MGNPVSKSQEFMEQRERINTECRKQGTLAMNLVREEFNRDIQEVYDLKSGDLLGKGGFGTVRVVTHRETQIKYALKTIELKDVETHAQYEFLLNEIEIMKKLDHPNIARVQEVFHTPDHYYMVMDLYTGGDMYARYKFRSEDETAKIVNKLINALRYCHDRNVAHRDIKLENICFESMADDAEVKLVDFGLSASFKDEQLRNDLVGSWAFMAPEVLQRAHHPQACDLWSMGVVTYCLLVGFPPFRSVNLKDMKEQILYSKVNFSEEPWKNVSDTAKDFILKLLRKDPRKRLTAQEAQQHPWLYSRPRSKWGKNAKLSPHVVQNLTLFKNLNLMKRVALGVVARTLEPSEMRNLEQEFHKADRTKSGVISIEDFREILLHSNQFPKKEVDDIFEGLDIGSSGLLSYTDFTAAALDRQTLDTRRLKYAFERLDHDNNGELDYNDLMMTVGSDLTSEDVRLALKQFDPKGNGKVTFDDFCKGMRSAGSLDALSTAQLTSGNMVERIAKGEGKEAIQQTLTEIERKSLELLRPPAPSTPGSVAERPPQEGSDTLEPLAASAGADASEEDTPTAVAAPGADAEIAPEAEAAAAAAATPPAGARHGSGARQFAANRVASPSSVASASTGRTPSEELDVDAADPEAVLLRQVPSGSGLAEHAEAPSGARGGESASVGGGAEATAPAPRKWSKEASPVGGGRVDSSVSPGGWAGNDVGESLRILKMDLAGEGTRGSLADRRLRDSIRIRGGLAGVLAAQATVFSRSSMPRSRSGTPSADNVASKRSQRSVSGARERNASPRAHRSSLLQPHAAKAGAAAVVASGKSGGDPAERHRVSAMRKKWCAPAADLPPKDSTAGEADLGWGSQGPPPDLAAMEPPPSEGGSNSSAASGNGARTPKALRFGGVTSKNGNQRGKRRTRPSRGLFCGGGDRRQGAYSKGAQSSANAAADDVYRNFSVTLDDHEDAQLRKRRGTFCMPGNASGDDLPFWVKWTEAIFGGKPPG